MYSLALTATEMNALIVAVIIKTTTTGAKTTPLVFYTVARQLTDLAYPATSGRSMVVDAAGLVDANAVKVGPTGTGTAQTARDLGGQLDAAVTTRLAPTVAGRTLDVNAGGEAGVDLDNTSGTLAKTTDITGFNDIAAADVWASVTRTLTGLGFTLAASDIGADAIGASEFSQAAADKVWSSVTRTLTALGFTIAASDFAAGAINAAALATDAANEIADALLDRAAGVETSRTVRQTLRFILAMAVGLLSGANTSTVRIRETNDTVDRVVATVDSVGNRTAVTLDAT